MLFSEGQCSPRDDATWKGDGNDDCCNKGGRGLCKEGEGDCDSNSDCEYPLECVKDREAIQ